MLSITYRETDNGFEAQECYAEQIRKIEKQFKTPNTTAREKLRDDIDRLLMRSNSLDELLEKLQKEKYEIKRGKYLAVKPQYGTNFLRLKSLGEQYSEYALINRLNAKKKYEFNLNDKINKTPQENKDSRFVLKTMQFYIITYSKGALPMKRKFNDKVYSWSNDAELNQLAELNQKLNSGANLDSLRYEFESKEHDIREKEEALAVSKAHLQSFYNLKEKILMVFENKKSDRFTLEQAQKTLQKYPNITSNNYKRVDLLIENEINAQKRLELELKIAREDIKKSAEMYSLAEKIVSGTYIQELVNIERQKRESNFIPNGYKSAD